MRHVQQVARRLPPANWPPAPAPTAHCALCERQPPMLTEHHLVPRSQGRRRGIKIAMLPTVRLCPACHKFLHKTFSNAELAGEFNSLDALLEREEVQRFVAWIKKQPATRGVKVR